MSPEKFGHSVPMVTTFAAVLVIVRDPAPDTDPAALARVISPPRLGAVSVIARLFVSEGMVKVPALWFVVMAIVVVPLMPTGLALVIGLVMPVLTMFRVTLFANVLASFKVMPPAPPAAIEVVNLRVPALTVVPPV